MSIILWFSFTLGVVTPKDVWGGNGMFRRILANYDGLRGSMACSQQRLLPTVEGGNGKYKPILDQGFFSGGYKEAVSCSPCQQKGRKQEQSHLPVVACKCEQH